MINNPDLGGDIKQSVVDCLVNVPFKHNFRLETSICQQILKLAMVWAKESYVLENNYLIL